MHRLALACLTLLAASPLRAQTALTPDALADWERSRVTVLRYIDAMPDSATGFRPTPGVRTFAEQFDHIVTTNYERAKQVIAGQKVGRNDPCPCGSGKKYKKCHGS